MNAVIEAIYDVLAGDATLTNLLAEFQGSPAIFSVDTVPASASPPWVRISVVTDIEDDSKVTRGRELLIDVSVWQSALDGEKALNEKADRILTLLHNQNLTVSGWEYIIAVASGPIPNEPDEELIGRTITVRLVIDQE